MIMEGIPFTDIISIDEAKVKEEPKEKTFLVTFKFRGGINK